MRRMPTDLRNYKAYVYHIKQNYGIVTNHLLTECLDWPTSSTDDPVDFFAKPKNIKVLRNPWPWGSEPGVVQLLVWTQFYFKRDTETGDVLDSSRSKTEHYLDHTFRNRMDPYNVRR